MGYSDEIFTTLTGVGVKQVYYNNRTNHQRLSFIVTEDSLQQLVGKEVLLSINWDRYHTCSSRIGDGEWGSATCIKPIAVPFLGEDAMITVSGRYIPRDNTIHFAHALEDGSSYGFIWITTTWYDGRIINYAWQ